MIPQKKHQTFFFPEYKNKKAKKTAESTPDLNTVIKLQEYVHNWRVNNSIEWYYA